MARWHRIGECDVKVDTNCVITKFSDGAVLHAHPNYGDEDIARARALGYIGTDQEAVDAMTRDHDMIHSLVAEARGFIWSEALHGAATGRGYAGGEDEERIVFLIQRLLNEGRSW